MALSQRIDGWIGYLREALLAVIPQRRGNPERNAGGASSTHAPQRLLTVPDHGLEEHAELVFGPAKSCHVAVGTVNIMRCFVRGRDY